MFNRKTRTFLLLTLIFITTFGISAASATDYDTNATDQLVVNDTFSEDLSSNVVSVDNIEAVDSKNTDISKTTTNDNVKSEGEGTFTELNTIVASNSDVKLDKDYSSSSSGSKITVNKEITIDADGHTLTSTKGIFTISTDGKLTLNNAIISGSTDVTSNFFDVSGTLILNNVTFTDCITQSSNYAPIYIQNNAAVSLNKVSMDGMQFSWSGNAYNPVYGYGTNITLNVQDCTFSNIKSYKGAIYFRNSAKADIKNTKFLNITAYYGGGIYASYSGVNMTVDGCLFEDDEVSYYASAIHASGLTTIRNSIFNNNKVTTSTYGGVIYYGQYSGYNLSLENNKFNGNTAKVQGADIYMYGGAVNSTVNIIGENLTVGTGEPATMNYIVTDDVGNLIDFKTAIFNITLNGIRNNTNTTNGLMSISVTAPNTLGEYPVTIAYNDNRLNGTVNIPETYLITKYKAPSKISVTPTSNYYDLLNDRLVLTVTVDDNEVNEGTIEIYDNSISSKPIVTTINLNETNTVDLKKYMGLTGSANQKDFYFHYTPVSEDVKESETTHKYSLQDYNRIGVSMDIDNRRPSGKLAELIKIPFVVKNANNNEVITEGIAQLKINEQVVDKFDLSDRTYAQLRSYETMNSQAFRIEYLGNDVYASTWWTGWVTVSGTSNIKPTVSISTDKSTYSNNEEVKVSVDINESIAPGSIEVYVNGTLVDTLDTTSYDSDDVMTEGIETVISIPHAGWHAITAKYITDETTYFEDSVSEITSIYVNPIGTTVTANDLELNKGETQQLQITLIDDEDNAVPNQTIAVEFYDSTNSLVSNLTTEKTDNQGKVSLTIPELNAGVYTAKIIYYGGQWQTKTLAEEVDGEDYIHDASDNTVTVTVKSSTIATNIEITANPIYATGYVDINGQLTADDNTVDLNGKTISLTIDGNSYTTTTGSDGSFTYDEITIDKYTESVPVTAQFIGVDNLEDSNIATTSFKVNYLPVSLTAENGLTTKVNKTLFIPFDLLDVNEQDTPTQGKVIVYDENDEIVETFINLFADTPEILAPVKNDGEFTLRIVYEDEGLVYEPKEISIKYTVEAIKTNITVNAENIYAGKNVNITGTFTTDVNYVALGGHVIKVTVNGTDYIALTKSDGSFVFNNLDLYSQATNIPVTAVFEKSSGLNASNTATDTFDVLIIPVELTAEKEVETTVNTPIDIAIDLKDSITKNTIAQGQLTILNQAGETVLELDLESASLVFNPDVSQNGTFTYTIRYADEGLMYDSNETTITVKVKNIETSITLDAQNIYAGQMVNISGTFTTSDSNMDLYEHNINININGTDYTVTTEDDGSFVFNNLRLNSSTTNVEVSAVFEGQDGLSTSNIATDTFDVLIIPVELTAEEETRTTVNKSVEIPINIKDTVNDNQIPIQGIIKVFGEDNKEVESYNFDVDHFEFIPDVENDGTFKYKIVYSDDASMYEGKEIEITVIVEAIQTNVTVNASNIYAGQNVNITGVLTANVEGIDLSGKNISITINGTSYNATTDDEGNFQFTDLVINAQAIDVPVTAKLDKINGLTESNQASTTFNVTLIPVELTATEEFNTIVGDNVDVTITLTDTINGGIPTQGTITVTKDGETFTTIDLTDELKFIHIASQPGEFAYVITFTDGIKYDTNEITVKVNVDQLTTQINATDVATDYGVDVVVPITLLDTVNGVVPTQGTITVTDDDGVVATIDVASDALEFVHAAVCDGEYIYTINFTDSANKYVSSQSTVKVTVNKLETIIGSEDVSTDYGVDVVIPISLNITLNNTLPKEGTITVLDENGETIATLNVTSDDLEFTHAAVCDGEYTYTIKYSAENNYEPSETTMKVTVGKLTTTISADNKTTNFGNDVIIIITLKDSNGNVPNEGIVTITDKDGKIVTIDVANDNLEFTHVANKTGVFEYTIAYSADNNYVESSTIMNVTVNSLATVISASDVSTDYGVDVVVPITLIDTVNDVVPTQGTITVTDADGVVATIDVASDALEFVHAAVCDGEYIYTINFTDSANKYVSSQSTVKVTVNKLDALISAENQTTNYGVDVVVTINLKYSKGNTPNEGTVTVLDENGEIVATLNVASDALEFTHAAIKDGEYAYTIKFTADNNYNPIENTTKVTVNKNSTVISAENQITDYGVDAVVTIDLKDVNGNIPNEGVVTVLDENGEIIATLNVTSDDLEFTHAAVCDGEYTYTIKYSAENNYEPSETTVKVTVGKLTTTISADNKTTNFGNDVTIIITLKDSNGNVPNEGIVTITGADGNVITLDVASDELKFTHSADKSGVFEYNIVYSADNNYVESSTIMNVTVNSLATFISASDVATDYGVDVVVPITLIDTVNDVVPTQGTITVADADGVPIATIDVANDELKFTHSAVQNGEYEYTITYVDANGKYVGSETTVKVTVNKLNTLISAENATTDYGVDVKVTIILEDVNGNVPKEGTVTVLDEDGEIIATLNVVSDALEFTHAAIKDGEYVYTIKFTADNNYNPIENTTKVTVNKLITEISAENVTTNFGVDSNVIINLKDIKNDELPKEGTVTITGADGNVIALDVTSDELKFTHIADKPGEFVYTIEYTAENNYIESQTTVKVTVNTNDVVLKFVEVTDTIIGENNIVSVELTCNDEKISDEEVIITIDGKDYKATTDENGIATVTKFTSRSVRTDVPVVVKYAGNNITGYSEALPVEDTFNVNKINTSIIINDADTSKGNDNVTISGKVTDELNRPLTGANVIITVNNVPIPVKADENGEFSVDVSGLNVGDNNISVTYSGNTRYESTEANKIVTLVKEDTKITLDEISTKAYRDNVTIAGKLTDAKDNVLSNTEVVFTINEETRILITDNDGKFNYTTKLTSVGARNVTVVYEGNANYNPSNASTTFDVIKKDTNIEITPLTAKTYGDNVTITGKFTNADGEALIKSNLVITINGISNAIVTDNKGEFTFTTKLTKVESENITVSYKGNSKYNPSNATTPLEVAKKDTNINIDDISVKSYKDEVVISGKFTNADGAALINSNVIVTVNGVSKTIKTDNKGIFNYTTKATIVGINNVTVSYNGNAKYNPSNASTTFDVIKKDTNIEIDTIDSNVYGDNVTVSGKFTNADGEALIRSNVVVTINGVSKTVKTDDEGLFTYTTKANKAGTNNVTVTYKGNAKYNPNNATTTFQTQKISTKLNLNVANTKVNTPTKIDITLTDENNNAVDDKVNLTINNETKEYDIKKDDFPLTTLQ